MSRELMQAYFVRDLSEAEDAALGEHLSASLQESEAFAAMAAADFARLGLKVPALKSGRRIWTWGVALVVSAGLGYGAWVETGHDEQPSRIGLQSSGEEFESVGLKSSDQGSSAAQLQMDVAARPGGKPGFMIQASRVSQNASAEVRDQAGNLVVALKANGSLGWEWNGNDAKAQHVRPGRYQLRVHDGNQVVSKWVEVEKK